MDTTKQRYEVDATGWQRGLYDDVQATFRAPVVNWIFRTTMANHPAFLRYAWGQLKPLFETRAFARYTIAHRDAVLSALEADGPLPRLRAGAVDVSPAEFREARAQVATFDVVAPRLAFLFEACDRLLHGERVGPGAGDADVPEPGGSEDGDPVADRALTAPEARALDADRGAKPSMASFDDPPDDVAATIGSIREFHGLGEGLPSIYRCLAQWPALLDPLWEGLEPRLESPAFDEGCEAAAAAVDAHLERAPYTPRLTPDDLRAVGFEAAVIDDVAGLFREFNAGAVETVVPALHALAAGLDVDGRRRP